ncbi:putative UV-B-induced protein [Helianthus annuus]|nr:putative UV-B-induced protein [Helianthus annuus]
MEYYCLSSSININNLPYSSPNSNNNINNRRFNGFSVVKRCRSRVVVAAACDYGGYCEFSSLNTPIVPVTPAGRFLSSVLLNERKSFHEAVAETLEKLVADVDEAYVRRALTADSSEADLHRFTIHIFN